MDNFKDKAVVITGGATGIGFALAKAFGGDGAKIVIGEPRQEKLDEAVRALGADGIDARATLCDVTKPESVEALADFAWGEHGGVDILINNAGVPQRMKSIFKLPFEDMHKVFDVNVFGVWYGSAIFGRRMIEQGSPCAIYNIASENAFFCAVPKTAAYIASKHAVMGLTDSMREEAPDFMAVGTIFPGLVLSDMTAGPIEDLAMPADDFAALVLKQIKAGAHYIVSHAYNIERINARHQDLTEAFTQYAPRYDGDDQHDVPTIMKKLLG